MTRRLSLLLLWMCIGACTRASSQPTCPPPLEPLPGGSCFAAPASLDGEVPLLIYLHGMTPSTEQVWREGLQVVEAARGRVAVLVPIGERGACTWNPELARHHCWPTDARLADELDRLADRLQKDVQAVASRLGAQGPLVPHLAGFSNGGFAAAFLAQRRKMDLASLVVLHAGGPVPFAPDADLPILLRAATGDEWHHPTMVDLRDRLIGAGRAPSWQERAGPHVLDPSDATAIVDFVRR